MGLSLGDEALGHSALCRQRPCSGLDPDRDEQQLERRQDMLPRLATPAYSWHMPPSENAASILRSLRREQGRSLRTAAADIGVAPSQLSRLERGQRGLGAEMSEKLSTYYGVPAEIISLAQGDVPADILGILQAHPEALDRLRELYPDSAQG